MEVLSSGWILSLTQAYPLKWKFWMFRCERTVGQFDVVGMPTFYFAGQRAAETTSSYQLCLLIFGSNAGQQHY